MNKYLKNNLILGAWLENFFGSITLLNVYKKRKELFANSKSVVVYAKVHSGIFNINRTLINNLDMSLEFAIDKNVKNLMCAENSTFKLVVEKASLKIRRIRISEELSVKID